MILYDYLEETRETQSAFGARIGRDRSTVNRLVNGKVRPDWPTLLAILRATGGRVTPNDFLSVDAEAAAE
jgi:transcriptional regulator with XRE-family HTH domain